MPNRPLKASFDQLAATLPATIGVAIVAPTRLYSFGQWSAGVAWSTIKVPLAVAALRNGDPEAKNLIDKAIANSDNAASEALWSQLGAPADAARKTQAVLTEAGDTDTEVESQRLRHGFTAFGQTQWTLQSQAQFASQLPRLPAAPQVIELMHNLTQDHRWGLAAKGFAAKGGWGPGTRSTYLVRQFGIVPTHSGHLGVALAAEAHDGRFETGVTAINTMADWLIENLPRLPQH